jgi:hypothetical protein
MMLSLQVLAIRTAHFEAPLINSMEMAALAKVSMDLLSSKSTNNRHGVLDALLNVTDSMITDFGSGPSDIDPIGLYRLGITVIFLVSLLVYH